jgi:DNA-directed RNA polymerase subunit beta
MPVTSQRRVHYKEVRKYGTEMDNMRVPPLTDIQTKSYDRFLQLNIPTEERGDFGLEGVLRETFPIDSYDGAIKLEYIKYELGKPRYSPDECRQLRLTYGRPFRVWLRLVKDEPIEEEVYLGDIPIMIGGGEFIVNGAERVVVSQLHRSPGVDFVYDMETSDKKLHSCRIIPERGSWVEIHVTRKETLGVRIDQSGKFSALTLLRAMAPEYSSDGAILREFYPEKSIKVSGEGEALVGKVAADDVIDPMDGEIFVEAGQTIKEVQAKKIANSSLKGKNVSTLDTVKDPLIINSLEEDNSETHEQALLKIYQRLRAGNPPQLEKAKALFAEKFFDANRYRLGRVGRFRMNRKLNQEVDETKMTLDVRDYINCIKYIMRLRDGQGDLDDIDHLGNRRLRTIDELAADELRKGFLKLRRTVQDRMNLKDQEEMTPRTLINPKSVSAAIDYFFGRGELSQVVDQTNPLSQLTHERRLSALGPGGLNRKRAGFEVRDVHISHYGRICPIETPEGTNIGLISSLAIYAQVDELGFLITPYRLCEQGRITNKVRWMRADEETQLKIAPADATSDGKEFREKLVPSRQAGEFQQFKNEEIERMDVSAMQMVGVSAGLIPFLEHDDANRALMGSNMQRQAVPLLEAEPPLVATGLERVVAENSSMVVRSEDDGVVTFVDGERIVVNDTIYKLRKYVGLNERTCLNQRPIVKLNEKVKKGQVLADGAATFQGQLALGRNVLVGFMSWEGYNFEDAIIISEELVKRDTYTSIHIEEFEVEIRETKLGREEFTRDIPNVSDKVLRNLDDVGIIRVGTYVRPGDILVGKVSPKSKSELTPEEKLLHAIFGRAGEDVKNDSLEVPSGVEGIVIHTQKFSRRMSLSEEERKAFEKELKEVETKGNEKIAELFRSFIVEFEESLGRQLKDKEGRGLGKEKEDKVVAEQAEQFRFDSVDIRSAQKIDNAREVYRRHWPKVEAALDERDRALNSLKRGDELPSGVLQMVKVYLATKRRISVGDKMAGRHGNKGVISKILPVEDMPFLEDGTPIEIMLNPLGVPSRMNVGQILETHLGWAAAKAGLQVITPVFNGIGEQEINRLLKEQGLPANGKVKLYDGRSGEPLEQDVTVGYIYMLKLHHLVDDKVHARATGPYSLITQQPLGGKARFGGQRFGEMEVWALEAYGAAYVLQELLTVKSDDVEGRTKIYESMVKNQNTLEAGTPASFEVLTNEIRGLALNLQLEKKRF